MTVNLDPKYRPHKNGLRVEAQSPAVRKKHQTDLVTTPSPEGEGFLGLLPGHLVRGPKCLTMH